MQRIHTLNRSVCKIKKWMAAYIAAVMLVSGLMPPDTARALTIREEEELSQEFLKAVFDAYDVISDPVINDYINTVGHKLISAMPPQPFDYKFYAVRQDAYNAFAGPRAEIFLYFPACSMPWKTKTNWRPCWPMKLPMCPAGIFRK